MNNHSQLIKFKTIRNCRDLSSMNNEEGFHIKSNSLFRCGRLSEADEDDMYTLYTKHNVRTIIDLRSPNEKYENPDTIIQDMRFVGIYLQKDSIVGVTQDEESIRKMREYFEELDKKCVDEDYSKKHMEGFYYSIGISDVAKDGFTEFFNILLNNEEGSILWHCSLGRDRAGMTTALLLKILGFSEQTIIDDYCYSNECVEIDNPISYNYSHCLSDYIKSFFKGIYDTYGEFENYIEAIGLDSHKIEKLKCKYLER